VLAHFFEHGRWDLLVETGVEGQRLMAEDQLFILMEAGLYLTATRGFAASEARICYERAESLCHSLNRPLLLYSALMGRYRYSLVTDRLTATMQIAQRIHSVAQEQNNAALLTGAYRVLASTLYFVGNFESAQHYAIRGIQLWRSGSVQFPAEEVVAPGVMCLCVSALAEWHLGQITCCQATMAEAISLARERKHMHVLAVALCFAGFLGHFEGNAAEVECLASEAIELSTRHHFAFWLAAGETFRGWARSVSGDTAEGLGWIERGIENMRAMGWMLCLPYAMAVKAEALHLADRTPEALAAITEAEALVERSEERWWSAELYRLRAVFLEAMGADGIQIEVEFREAIRTAKHQKSISLMKRAEASYAEYCSQKGKKPVDTET
jgi:predicted ATPase